jgi:hypothetical protein
VERGRWKDRGRVRAYPRGCDFQFILLPPPMCRLGSRLGIVRLIFERTDDLRRGAVCLPSTLRCGSCKDMPASDRSWEGWRLASKDIVRRSPERESTGTHGSTLRPRSSSPSRSLESTEIMSYTCSIVHRDASSGASKSRIEFISPASACAPFPSL